MSNEDNVVKINDDIVIAPLETSFDLPVVKVLEAAINDMNYRSVIVLGYTDNEDDVALQSTMADIDKIIGLMEKTKHRLLTL